MALANHRQAYQMFRRDREKSFGAPEVQITPLGCPNLALCPNDFSLQIALKNLRPADALSRRKKKMKLSMEPT